ncbi:uncharacterized protein LOC131656432 [Vicia villosa]|uniref:uncharacterized protein LOC131656432 n=2 Tax=Vicia villosa TaxID=3911 RepID=UPI00273B8B4F|nr:uncharacterized protein LOC131656432 [Vicia villosa]
MEEWKKQHERLNLVEEAASVVENKRNDGDGIGSSVGLSDTADLNEYIMISSDSEREMSPIQEELEEAYWTREVHDVKKFCSNVMHIPAEIVDKCGLAGMAEITLNDVDNGYPYECNVKKRPKKNETYLYGEWFDYVRAAELKEGDKVHFVIYYPPVLDIMVTVERSGDR